MRRQPELRDRQKADRRVVDAVQHVGHGEAVGISPRKKGATPGPRVSRPSTGSRSALIGATRRCLSAIGQRAKKIRIDESAKELIELPRRCGINIDAICPLEVARARLQPHSIDDRMRPKRLRRCLRQVRSSVCGEGRDGREGSREHRTASLQDGAGRGGFMRAGRREAARGRRHALIEIGRGATSGSDDGRRTTEHREHLHLLGVEQRMQSQPAASLRVF
jgi:hypothetical protein